MSSSTEAVMGHREVIGAVLAGGSSTRMGRPKHELQLADGRSMISHVLEALQACSNRTAIVGLAVIPEPELHFGVLHVEDLYPHNGPLAGVHALLSSELAGGYIVAACDQPLLTRKILALLLHGADARPRFFCTPGRQLDPLPGYVPVEWLPRVEQALQTGQRSFRKLIAESDVEWIELDAETARRLRSFNTPEDIIELIRDMLEDTADA